MEKEDTKNLDDNKSSSEVKNEISEKEIEEKER